jgi:hypothetical protein
MDQSPKQSIVERIKSATNILVTVSNNPSVDALSAALALTLMLNKMDKHATAVFSGKIPSAIEFLEPGKTFENTIDSLRDFIIALDKEKADRLRYKVEDDVVRIFITPYRTVISEKDLSFTQGDFNVELVIALGVERREELDQAIAAHGRILHDATVVTINDDGKKTGLGTIDWSDDSVSSLCEMLMSLSEALKSGLLDEQIASALLTGLVAATERFSNPHTSPRVMTMAAQLMAAGANQQLIAAKLEEGHVLPSVSQVAPPPAQAPAEGAPEAEEPTSSKGDGAGGSLHISHGGPSSLPPVQPLAPPTPPAPEQYAPQAPAYPPTPPAYPKPPTTYEEAAQEELAKHITVPAKPTFTVSDLQHDLAEAEDELKAAAAPLTDGTPLISPAKGGWRGRDIEPTFGGTLNATTDEAEEEKHREELSSQNHKLLDHSSFAPSNAVPAYAQEEPEAVDPFAEPPRAEPDAPMHYEATPLPPAPAEPTPWAPPATTPPPMEPSAPAEQPYVPPAAPVGPTLEEIEAQAKGMAAPAASVSPLDDARAAVDAALTGNSGGFAPEPPASMPTPPPAPMPPSFGAPQPPLGATPPLPDFSTLPPLPSDVPPQPPMTPHVGMPEIPPTPPPQSNDPGQFKIPGQ